MSLLQIGGREFIWRTISQCSGLDPQQLKNIDIEGPLASSLPYAASSVAQLSLPPSPQKILLHRLAALRALGATSEARLSWIQQASAAGNSVHFYSYDEFTECWSEEDIALLMKGAFTSISLGSPFLAEQTAHWCLMPCGVAIAAIQPQFRTPKPQQVHLLYLAHDGADAEAQFIADTFSALKNSGLKFSASVFGANEVQSSEEIDALIGACDVFIEQLRHPYFGSLAIYAMAKGKPVISRNAPENQKFAHHYSLSPVLDATTDNLFARLHAIIREPICLRDLNKRSRQYVETFHNADLIYSGFLE